MSFSLQYDKDGLPIRQPEPPVQEQIEMQPQEQQTHVVQEPQEQEEQVLQEESVEQEEVVEQEPQPTKRKPTPAESFAELKKAKLREERERLRLEAEKQELLARLAAYEKNQQPQAQEDDDEIRVNPDDLLEGRHLSKVGKKIAKLEQKLSQYEQQTKQIAIETRLKAQYPDFERVVNPSNIELLKAQHPEIAQTLGTSSDLYATAVAAYTMIKKLGIADEEIAINSTRIASNAVKPRSMATVAPQQGSSPLARANAFAQGLTPELQQQLLKEMQEARKKW